MGAPKHSVLRLQQLYHNQEATVRTDHSNCDWFSIKKGVRQGCILSPELFNLYAEAIMRNVELDEEMDGIRLGGRLITNLRYADDTSTTASRTSRLELSLSKVKASEDAGLHLHLQKTKMFPTNDMTAFTLNDRAHSSCR